MTIKSMLQNGWGRLRFPYIFHHRNFFADGTVIKFRINNHIEDFRLRKFGSEKVYTQSIIHSLLPDDLFFDIGASVGAVSIPAALMLKRGMVYSFEPDPDNLNVLQTNYQINGLFNYRILAMAVGDHAGSVRLFTKGSNGPSPSLKAVNGIDHSITVPINSVDEMIRQQQLPVPTVVKIDIEGAEMQALYGMKQLLASANRPRMIFLELHPQYLPAFHSDTSEVLQFILNHNYKINRFTHRDGQILCDFHYQRDQKQDRADSEQLEQKINQKA